MPFQPIRDITEIYESLDDRVMAGFGGVAEYGITVRWNKNFLKVIRLLLERRARVRMFGGVRFGGTLTIDSAFEHGLRSHRAVHGRGPADGHPDEERSGPRRPAGVGLPDGSAADRRGEDRFGGEPAGPMPIVVIGGGLTAIDTATESLAYYVVQVEKFLERYETLAAERGEAAVRDSWTPEESETGDRVPGACAARFAPSGRRGREGRGRQSDPAAELLGRRHDRLSPPSDRFAQLHAESRRSRARRWRKACGSPNACRRKKWRSTRTATPRRSGFRSIAFDAETGKMVRPGETVTLPARTILVAAGTQPNTVLAREDEHNVLLDGR